MDTVTPPTLRHENTQSVSMGWRQASIQPERWRSFPEPGVLRTSE